MLFNITKDFINIAILFFSFVVIVFLVLIIFRIVFSFIVCIGEFISELKQAIYICFIDKSDKQ